MRRNLLLAGSLILPVYLSISALLPGNSFWITDGGNRFIQLESFLRRGVRDFTIDYPARDLDPGRRFFPYSGHHFQNIQGRIYSFYPPWYSLFCLPFYKLFGFRALDLLSVLAGLGTLLLSALWIGKSGSTITVTETLILAFATPLFFYSLVFWEHALFVFLALCAVYWLTPGRVRDVSFLARFAAGAALGLAAVFREEGYVLIAAGLVVVLVAAADKRRLIAAALGLLSVLVPLWISQDYFFGHFLGIHARVFSAAGKGFADPLSWPGLWDKLTDFAIYLFQAHRSVAVSALLALPAAAALVLGLFTRDPARRPLPVWSIIGAAGAAGLAVPVLMVAQGDWVLNTVYTQGLFPTTPFLVLVLVFFRSFLSSRETWVRGAAVFLPGYVLLSCLLLNHRDIGVIWGPRFFLVLFPLCVPLAWRAAQQLRASVAGRKLARLCLFGLVLLFVESAAIQSFGLLTLFVKRNAGSRIVDAMQRSGSEVIVSDVYWLAEEAAAIFQRKKILWVRADDDYATVFAVLKAAGLNSATVVFSDRFSRTDPRLIREILANSPARSTLEFKHAALLNVVLATVATGGGP